MIESKLDESEPLEDNSNSISNKANREDRERVPNNENGVACQILKDDVRESFESCKLNRTQSSPDGMSKLDMSGSGIPVGSKRSNEDMEANENNKKARTVIIASDDEANITVKDDLISSKLEDQFTMPEKSDADVGVESISSECLTDKFICTACHKVAVEVQQHPLLKVIVCRDCKCFLEEKMHMKVLIVQTNCLVDNILVILLNSPMK